MSKFNPQKKQESGPRIPIPVRGIVPARIARIVEIGEHDTYYGVKDQLYIWYSLPTRLIDMPESDFHGKQSMIRTKPLRKSSSEKAALMLDHINILQPECQELDTLLNVAGFVTIDHNEVESGGEVRTFANITQVSGVPEGIDVGELDTPTFYFSFDAPDEDVWENQLWDRIRDQIKDALNYKGSAVEEMVLRLEAMKA
jgi:hypothetical protein